MISIYDVLKASKGIHVDDTFAELWGKKLSNAYTVATYIGTLPATLTGTTAGYLESYRLYGTSEGAGVETESGEPAGYKLPLTVTSGVYNLVDIESISLLSNNRYGIAIDTPGIYTITAFANSSAYVYCRSYNANNDPISDNLSVVSSSGKITTRTLTINQGEKIYVFDPLTTSTLASTKAKFTNDYIVAVSGSTAPDHYIPHRYTADYNLYIGSTKLVAEEYVDYAEQKVYKRTGNDFPFAKKGTFAFGNNGSIISDGKGKLVISMPSTIPSGTKSELIPLDRAYTIPQSVDTGGEFIFYIGNNVDKLRLLLCFYDADGVQIENWACSPAWRTNTAYNQMTGETIAYIGVRAASSGASGNIELTPMFSKNADLTSYISYLQPTDPPVPFPQIPTSASSTTISWAGEGLAPSEVELTYRKLKGQ